MWKKAIDLTLYLAACTIVGTGLLLAYRSHGGGDNGRMVFLGYSRHERDIVSLGQAIVDPTRVRIIAALKKGALCVCELVDALEIGQSTLSTHLQVLRQTGMVITRKEGRWVYYSLDKRRAALMDAIFSLVEKDIGNDPRLIRDAQRVEGRLAIRENGRCTLGFSELGKSEVLTHARMS